jgi:hypothetical protein
MHSHVVNNIQETYITYNTLMDTQIKIQEFMALLVCLLLL